MDSFYTLSLDKNRHFLTPSPPHLFHVVIECPYWMSPKGKTSKLANDTEVRSQTSRCTSFFYCLPALHFFAGRNIMRLRHRGPLRQDVQTFFSLSTYGVVCCIHSILLPFSNFSFYHLLTWEWRLKQICKRMVVKFELSEWVIGKVRLFWEGHKILRNLHFTFVYSTYRQK